VHDTLKAWGHEPLMLDTTRVRQLGIGHHGRKNDAIDSELIALAVDAGRVPLAHILSPARRELRAKLSVRRELVELRARQVTIIRGLARAAGERIRSSASNKFLAHVETASLGNQTRSLIAPLLETLKVAEEQITKIEAELVALVADDPLVNICATVPGVGLIVGASYVSVLDDAKRFRNGDAVASYYGLAPSEATTGGPNNRRLGGITKHGNTYARSMLVEAAWQIMISRAEDNPLRKWACHVADRRGKKVAAVALARRLATMLWAMCRDGTVYDPAMVARESASGMRRTSQHNKVVEQAMANVAAKLAVRLAPLLKRASPKKTSKTKSSLRATG
jgi:transposase